MVGNMKKSLVEQLNKYKAYGPFLLRIAVGIIFLAHGYGKLWGSSPGLDAWISMVTQLGFPLPIFLAYLVGLIEFAGGLALIVGFGTRYAGLLLGLIMIVAIVKVKLAKGLLGGYELDLALLAASFSLAVTGPGVWAIDSES